MTPVSVTLVAFGVLALILAFKGTRTLHEALNPGLYRSASFPENRFPATDPHAFQARVERGYARMRDVSVIFCGITRNDGQALPLTIARIAATAECFRDYRVVVFENDSTDSTPTILSEWAASDPRITVLSESPGDPSPAGGRYESLARHRNRYVEWLNDADEPDGFEYVIVLDFDLRGGWSLDGLASTFAEDGWDAVGSNSLGYHYLRPTYYDMAALRPADVLQTTWWHRLIGEARQLPRGARMIPVQSAFGGLGVYRREVFRSRRYSGMGEDGPACEHLSLNADGRLRFFLNPSQITVVGSQEARALRDSWPPWCWKLHMFFTNW